MTEKITAALFLIVGVVNLIPMAVFFDIRQTTKLYGVEVTDSTMLVLMRHRAILLGIVGIILIYAAIRPEARWIAFGLAALSKISFIYLWATSSGSSAEIRKVALIDVAAMVVLCVASGLNYLKR